MSDGLLMGADGGDEDAEGEDEDLEDDSEIVPKAEKRKWINDDDSEVLDNKSFIKKVVVNQRSQPVLHVQGSQLQLNR